MPVNHSRLNSSLTTALLPCILAAASACGGDDGSGTLTARFAVNGVNNKSFMLASEWEGQKYFDLLSGPSIFSAGDVGQIASASELTSLQFFVTRIQLCESMTVTGSGYSSQTGCTTIYTGGDGDNAYESYKIAQAEADTSTSNWVDLMSKTSIDAFTSRVSAVAAGTYNYGIIEVRKPYKMNAQFSATNAANMRTCAGGTVTSSGSAESLRETATVSNMTSCTRATATLGGQGGGRFFKFQQPFTVTAGQSYELDLAFDPIGSVYGGVEGAGGWGTEATYKDGTRVMVFPNVNFSPVVRTSSQKTIREQYTLTGITGFTGGSFVVDLYYAGELSNVGTGTVLGAQVRASHGASSTVLQKVDSPQAIEVTNGTITLKNWQGNAIVSGLTRSTTQTTGGTQSVSVNAATFTTSSGGAGSGTVSGVTATFNGVTAL